MSVSGHIKAMTVGGNKVTTAYFNGQLVFQEVDAEGYVTFTGNQMYTVSMPRKYWDGTMEYSTDGTNWTTWTCSAVTCNSSFKIYFRGIGNTKVTGSNSTSFYQGFVVSAVSSSSTELSFTVSGDLLNLLDYTKVASGTAISPAQYCFAYLFAGQNITSCSDLTMTSVPKYGYYNMFKTCGMLTVAPTVAAQTVADYGLSCMFYGCSALKETPYLDLVSLSQYACNSMFASCTSLTKINMSETRVTAVASYAYYCMFTGCSALVNGVPSEIHIGSYDGKATYNLYNIFSSMFESCTMLTTTPDFYVHSGVAVNTFSMAFKGCNSLTTPGSINIVDTASSGTGMFASMFYRCISLTSLPEMNGVTFGLKNQCDSMFYYCMQLKQIYMFNTLGGTQTTIASGAFVNMFNYTGVTVAAAGTYSTSYQLVLTSVTTEASIYNFTSGVSPLVPNTVYSTNAGTIVMVN